jgi:hypothetical protein
MNAERQAEIFARRKEPAIVCGTASPSTETPISLGMAILLVSDPSEAGSSVRFGVDEFLTAIECEDLKRRYKDELLLDDAAERPD